MSTDGLKTGIGLIVDDAVKDWRSAFDGTDVMALVAIRDEAQAQLLALKSSMLPSLRAQIAALEAVEAKVGRRKGSRNKPKEQGVAQ